MSILSTMADDSRAGIQNGVRRALRLALVLLAAGLGPTAAQTPPPAPPEQHYQAAKAAIAAGDLERASLEAKLALQENPVDAASHFLLAGLLEKKGQSDLAIVGYQQALTLDPSNPDALYNLGTILLRRGEAVPASHLLENAVLVRPDHVPTYNNLGKAYYLAGLPELAVAAYEEALRRDSSNTVSLKNLLLLAEASGMPDAAASYRKRLETIGTGQPAAPGPIWPLAARTVALASAPAAPESGAQSPQTPRDEEVASLQDLLRDIPHVKVERRGGRITLTGWTRSPKEKEMLGRILGKSEVLDLTSDDIGDTQRMVEIDAIIFVQYGISRTSVGFNFLRLVQTNFSYFASDHTREGTGFSAPGTIGAVTGLSQMGWLFSAAVDYSVTIANASKDQVAVIARPHLTTLNGTPAKFLAGGEIVFKVSGINSGDIKPYPYGTVLTITPTLLRTLDENGSPRVHVTVEAGRTSVLALLDATVALQENVSFDKISVTNQAIVGLGQTLILSGLSQRESRTSVSGVPGLMHIPILKYFFSTKSTVQNDSSVIVLLTPREPAFMDERNRAALATFVEKRRAYLQANQGTDEDMRRFKERYPDWGVIAPNRFASHFFLMSNSEVYRAVSGQDLLTEGLDLQLLGKPSKKK